MSDENAVATATTDTPALSEAVSAPAPEAKEDVVTEIDAGESGNDDAELDSQLSAIFRKTHPDRDESGRFRSSKPAQEAGQTETEVSPDQSLTEEVKTVEEPSIPPPSAWSTEAKAKWSTLSPDVQAVIAKREKEASDAITRQGSELSAYKPIKQVVEQFKDVFERYGVTPDDGIGRLLEANRRLETDPYAAIAELANAYGVDLGYYSQQAKQQGSLPPEVAQLHRQIADQQRQIQEMSNWLANRDRQETETRTQSANALLEKFSADKADEWAELENDIHAELLALNAQVEAGLIEPLSSEQKLERAYKRALQLNPDVQKRKQEAQRKAEQERQVEEAKKRADAAHRAKAVNIASQPVAAKQIRSMDDDLRDTYRRAQSR